MTSGTGVNGTGIMVFLALGSNQGERLEHLQGAVLELDAHPEISVLIVSGVFETEFVGPGEQDPYLNACLSLKTALKSRALLTILKGIEHHHGRRSQGHMLPRPLDLDILLYGNEVRADSDLQLPHPRMTQRAFVMEPLAQIAPDEIIPNLGETVGQLCAKIRQKSGFRLQEDPERVLLTPGDPSNPLPE